MSAETPDDGAFVWAKAAAAVLAKAGREVDGADPIAVAEALSATSAEGVPVPALGTPFLTPARLAVDLGGTPDWNIVERVEAGVLAPPLASDRLVDGTAAADQGAGDIAELAYVLARGVALLRLDVPAAEIGFRISVTGEFFVSIAKLRALRATWGRILEVCGLTVSPPRIHAVTASRMMTDVDVHTNLLRTTAAALGAVVGGADVLTVLPFDVHAERPSALGERLARNISHLMAGESFLTRDADAAAGAFAVEELTRRVSTAAWAEFQRLDGDLAGALGDGSLESQWQTAAAQREADIESGARIVVGVNKYRAAS